MFSNHIRLAKRSILLLVFGIASCGNKTKIPSDVIGLDSMRTLIWDISVASEYVNVDTSAYVRLHRNDLTEYQIAQVLKKHKISPAQYRKSIDFYAQNPKLQSSIVDSIVSYGKEKEEVVNKRKAKADSIVEAKKKLKAKTSLKDSI